MTEKLRSAAIPESEELLSEEEVIPSRQTPIAQHVQHLREAALSAAKTRERLPQPLFWSVFQSELSEIKAKKNRERTLRKVLLGFDPEKP